MRFTPIIEAFIIAIAGAAAVGLRPGYPLGALLLGATIVAAMAGLAASVIQFVPNRAFIPVAIVGGGLLGVLVLPLLTRIERLGFGDVQRTTSFVWPTAIVATLLLSRALGMRLPAARRRHRLRAFRRRQRSAGFQRL